MKTQGRNRSLITAVLVGALVVLCFVLSRPKRLTARLANGTELSVLAVTHGVSNNFFLPGGILEKLVYYCGSKKGVTFGPIKIGPASPIVDYWAKQDGSPAFPNRMVVWIGHMGPSNAPPLPVPEAKWHSDIRATLANESGEEWEMRTSTASVRSRTSHGLNGISSWDFTSYPRRGKTLRLRIYARDSSNQWDTLADFTLPNPTPGPYPTWKPADLPDTRKSIDLEVSLVKLVSGIKFLPYFREDRQFTTATFEVKENGRTTDVWVPDELEMSDATGNEPWFPALSIQATNHLTIYEIAGTSLSPSEVWRLRVRFAKEKDPDSKRTWSSPAVAVTNGGLETMDLTTNLENIRVTFSCSKTQFDNTIHLRVHPQPRDSKLQRPEIIDDRGRTVRFQSSIFDDGFDAQLAIPDGAEWIKVTTGLAETREFEFVARPTAVVRNER